MHVKAFVPGTEGMTHPDSRSHKQFHLCALGGLQALQDDIWAIVLQDEMTTAQDTV